MKFSDLRHWILRMDLNDDLGPTKGLITRSTTRKTQELWEDSKTCGPNRVQLLMIWVKEDVKI